MFSDLINSKYAKDKRKKKSTLKKEKGRKK